MNTKRIIKEACVETLEQAMNAEKQGANRVELCGDLSVGGITPSDALVTATVNALSIPIMLMVRPRGGDFVYSEQEFDEMLHTIERFKAMGVAGVVFGCLTVDHQIDVAKTRALAVAARPMEVTFHKAFDALDDQLEGLAVLKKIKGIHRVLTSGGAATAKQGSAMLIQLIAESKGVITILSAGKITATNLEEHDAIIGGKEYHGRLIVGELTPSDS